TRRDEDDGEFRLLFRGGGGARATRAGCRDRDGRCRRRDAELVFHFLDELRELEHAHAADRVEDVLLGECHGCFLLVCWLSGIGKSDQAAAFSFWSRTAASVRTNLAGSSFSVCTNLAIGACIVPSSFARSSSRLGIVASWPTSFALITWPDIAPPLMTSFSLP